MLFESNKNFHDLRNRIRDEWIDPPHTPEHVYNPPSYIDEYDDERVCVTFRQGTSGGRKGSSGGTRKKKVLKREEGGGQRRTEKTEKDREEEEEGEDGEGQKD